MVALLLSVSFCFLSFPRCFCHSTLFHFAPCPFCPCLSFMKGWCGLLGFTILLSLHGPIGLSVAISCRAGLLGLISFFLSFRGFAARYFFVLLLSFLGPVGLSTIIFYQSGPLGLISFFSSFYGPFTLTIAYQSLSFISSLLVTRLFCCWASFIRNEYQQQQT